MSNTMSEYSGVLGKSLQFGAYGLLGCVLGSILGLLALPRPDEAPKSTSPPVDIMFVLDITGSMGEEIEGVRRGMQDFVGTFRDEKLDARVGLLTFKDQTFGQRDAGDTEGDDLKLIKFNGSNFTANAEEFRVASAQVTAGGGGDEAESSADALALAAKVDGWRPGAQRVIILITDAPPHIPDKETASMAAVKEAFDANKINQFHLVAQSGDRQQFEVLNPAEFHEIAESSAARLNFGLKLPELAKGIVKITSPLHAGKEFTSQQLLVVTFATCVASGLMGIGCFLALVIGQNYYLRKPLIAVPQLLGGVPGSFAAGLVAGAVGIALSSSLSTIIGAVASSLKLDANMIANLTSTLAQQVVSWAALGGLLAFGIAFFVPNMKRGKALLGGGLGGIVAALVISVLSPVLNNRFFAGLVGQGAIDALMQLFGAAILGGFIGLVVALVEAAFREAWLEVAYGPKEIRTVSLGKEPITVGGDRRQATIGINGAPPLALRYRFQDGAVLCEDLVTGQSANAVPNQSRTLGNATLTVRTSGARGAATTKPPPVPTALYSIRLTNGRIVKLAVGARLSSADVPGLEPQNTGGPIAEVAAHPTDPSILGLKNLSRKSWAMSTPNGQEKKVDPGRSVSLAKGVKVKFGPLDGEVV